MMHEISLVLLRLLTMRQRFSLYRELGNKIKCSMQSVRKEPPTYLLISCYSMVG